MELGVGVVPWGDPNFAGSGAACLAQGVVGVVVVSIRPVLGKLQHFQPLHPLDPPLHTQHT